MTQEEKKLLLVDLCGRLPYGVKCQIDTGDADVYVDTLATITIDGCVCFLETIDTEDVLEYGDIKPLLFPLSSMTEEQEEELKTMYYSFNGMFHYTERIFDRIPFSKMKYFPYQIEEFFNKNHFDYRGLIPMGLAKDATGLNIYY